MALDESSQDECAFTVLRGNTLYLYSAIPA